VLTAAVVVEVLERGCDVGQPVVQLLKLLQMQMERVVFTSLLWHDS
jgi:hypothetical protein